ncbi:uncharacterized protein MONOS_346 [Monocercomonoides exilis]|uniref:uncharacterized protein n=1 Tax=Monocercomonoides exilis TaxID=2049356 RepID=UPI00355A2DFC|nr:hypothetical protein MONOS_346 [Monocercomonoides exilis]|eukprot:MONOS_346.1-p1 / transcript=MONOS_346.1 / gene=MONOS_346 / organism=Monocercomonoides_exilis_PA203 / gene_product=unspecified product / transcript_product=unspecified product / location=Mono_scaffold00005:307349-307987(+) / protein_length=213 / sequence_SO=supercontig / SO=protein_coding / is_pseudo=false
MDRLKDERNFEEVIVNELHFVRETRRELEKLSKCVDGKRKEGNGGKEIIIRRWIDVFDRYLTRYTLWNEELAGVIGSLVQLSRASRDNYPDTSKQCFIIFRRVAECVIVKIDSLLKSGVVGAVLEKMEQSTLDDGIMWDCLYFFLNLSRRFDEKADGEMDETKRIELKRKIFEKMEEEGYEDIVASLYGVISFINLNYNELSKYLADYFVNI